MLLMSVVRFQEIIFYLCRVKQLAHTYWKVFSKVLVWKCGSFQSRRTTDGTHSWYILLWTGKLCPDVSHIYRVWGIGIVYFCLGLTTTFIQANEIGLTLFFYPQLNFFGGWGRYKEVNMDIIPEEKFFVKMVDDSLLPQLIRSVGTRFEPCVNSDGTHGNKRILIYQELCVYV